jgi:HAD superfamily hydrolase (TIGR01549 family)
LVARGRRIILTNKIKAILFDIGGTLVNKQNHGYRNLAVINEMVRFLDVRSSPEELVTQITAGENEYKAWKKRTFVELPPEERWSRFLLPGYPESFIRQNAAQLQIWWSESRGKRWVDPETIATIRELTARGYILGTISHTSPKYLLETGISELFKVSIYAAEFGKRKPHPSLFIEAARQLNLLPEECAYVGDRPSRDVIGSREAGIGKVIVLQQDDSMAETEPCPMQADGVIQNINELLDFFPGLTDEERTIQKAAEPILLYDAAISTMWWTKENDSAMDFFTKGRQLGFARFELNHQITPEQLASIDLNQFHIGSLHDPCPAVIPAKQLEREDRVVTSLDETFRQFGVDVVKRTINDAYRLGARSVVIHPGRIVGDHSMDDQLRVLYKQGLKGTPEFDDLHAALIADRKVRSVPHLEALVKSLHEIVAFSQDIGVTLGFENRLRYYELPIFDEMEVLMAEFQQPWVGWQFDVGHLKIQDELGLSSFRGWVERFDERIVGVHLHDVHGIVDHRAPGSGDVDFKFIAAHLPPYSQRTLEVDKSVSFEDIKTGMEALAAAGCVTRI